MRAAAAEVTSSAMRGGMSTEPKATAGRMPYEAPKIKTISLRPEEAVLGHCKTFSGGSNFNSGGGCTPFPVVCNSVGS